MININFRRFDSATKVEGFTYRSTNNGTDLDHDFASTHMDNAGFNQVVHIQNYLAETVLLSGNLSADPTKIVSLRREKTRLRDDFNNYVIITILTSENSNTSDPKKRNLHQRKIDIRIPGKMLNQGSVFIAELGAYIMTESQGDATRELMARDVTNTKTASINIPTSMVKQDPAKLYIEHKQLVQFCIQKQDKISIRIGRDLNYDVIPDIVKTMRISILDSYFVPYSSYKLVYDPALGEDEFVIENLYTASNDEYKSTFTDLAKTRVTYLDHDEHETLFGRYYGIGVFADEDAYLAYVHQRKSQERFTDEMLYVADRSGDPLLKEKIVKLESINDGNKLIINDKENMITSLREDNKRLTTDVRNRENTIAKIKDQHDAKMGPDVILAELDNDRRRIETDSQKITHEENELIHKEKLQPLTQKAVMWKTVADMMKSGWGIATACIGGLLSLLALAKKYNLRLTMG